MNEYSHLIDEKTEFPGIEDLIHISYELVFQSPIKKSDIKCRFKSVLMNKINPTKGPKEALNKKPVGVTPKKGQFHRDCLQNSLFREVSHKL